MLDTIHVVFWAPMLDQAHRASYVCWDTGLCSTFDTLSKSVLGLRGVAVESESTHLERK